ncbi:MAG: hypothetical protein D6803_02410 [Anaerolineae bacterium]|nr:MAG: hypothetical protein D6803_02410 [Anaerolineae bacterium]
MSENNAPLSRREFLKLASLLPLSLLVPRQWFQGVTPAGDRPNILVLVFDAWSAENISLYGYPRRTTPNIERLAESAIVYHNHHAGGHFTTPGTASLLTGTTPWQHRAFKHNDRVAASKVQHNIFHAFADYHRVAYTHNPLANTLLKQFLADIEQHYPWQYLYLESDRLVTTLFKNDLDTALIGWRRAMKRLDAGHAYTLYLSQIYENIKKRHLAGLLPQFPRDIPNYNGLGLNYFTLEEGIDWLAGLAGGLPQPFLGYFHFLPPHDPYNTRREFVDAFAGDGYSPVEKPLHPLDQTIEPQRMRRNHRWYDEFILYVDAEFARLFDILENSGLLENTWLVVTSDHGEMFERGILGHIMPVFHQPISHIPLMIFPPGQRERVDIYDRTFAVDLLPTLLHLSGNPIPDWTEGSVLPPFAPNPPADRDLTTLQVEGYYADGSVAQATLMLIRGNYKIMWYFGYEQLEDKEFIELYDLAADPGERHNLYPQRRDLAEPMLATLREKLDALNNAG